LKLNVLAYLTITSSMEVSKRDIIDDYDLVQRVGSGTYGDVYKV